MEESSNTRSNKSGEFSLPLCHALQLYLLLFFGVAYLLYTKLPTAFWILVAVFCCGLIWRVFLDVQGILERWTARKEAIARLVSHE